MKFRHILLTASDTTGFIGLPTIEIGLTADDDPNADELNLRETIDVLNEFLKRFNIKSPPLVTIDNSVPGDREVGDALELVEVLNSKKYVTIGKSPGHTFAPFIAKCAYKVATLTNEPWINYAVNEVQYTPTQREEWKEPLFEQHNFTCAKTLITQPNTIPLVLLNFINKSYFTWSIRTQHQPPFTMKA